jgi:hypothetical protein
MAAIDEGRGEYTLVIGPDERADSQPDSPQPKALADEFGRLIETENLGRREAIKRLAVKYGLSARAVYAMVEEGR